MIAHTSEGSGEERIQKLAIARLQQSAWALRNTQARNPNTICRMVKPGKHICFTPHQVNHFDTGPFPFTNDHS